MILFFSFAVNVEARGGRQYYRQPQVFASVPATPQPTVVIPKTTGTTEVGSAQWKAEISASRNSVSHIGGHFGGGSYEGNGFGATPDQAIANACYWGQKTPIQIGVARGSNGYYATIFYR